MDLWPILEEELIRYRDISLSVGRILNSYEKECQTLFLQMRGMSFEDAQIIFEKLYAMQEKLAMSVYKYNFPINEKLQAFVYHFERDDIYSRKYWYEKCNDGMTWPNEK